MYKIEIKITEGTKQKPIIRTKEFELVETTDWRLNKASLSYFKEDITRYFDEVKGELVEVSDTEKERYNIAGKVKFMKKVELDELKETSEKEELRQVAKELIKEGQHNAKYNKFELTPVKDAIKYVDFLREGYKNVGKGGACVFSFATMDRLSEIPDDREVIGKTYYDGEEVLVLIDKLIKKDITQKSHRVRQALETFEKFVKN